MVSEADADAAVITMQVITIVVECGAAAAELEAMGITPSEADVLAWCSASPKDKHRLGLQWAVMRASPEPEWKARK